MGPDHACEKGVLRWEGAANCKVYGLSAVSCAKTAEPIKMPFRMWTRVGPRKHVLDGVHFGATWRMLLNRPCAGGDAAFFVKLL